MKKKFLIILSVCLLLALGFTSCKQSVDNRAVVNVLVHNNQKSELVEIEKAFEKQNKDINLVFTFGSNEELSTFLEENKCRAVIISEKEELLYMMDECSKSVSGRQILDLAKLPLGTNSKLPSFDKLYSASIIENNYEKSFINGSEEFYRWSRLKTEADEQNNTNIGKLMSFLQSDECIKILTDNGYRVLEAIKHGTIEENIVNKENSELSVKVNVYLPPDYSKDNTPYKAIFFNDGDIYQSVQESYDRMISYNQIEPFIGVFIQLNGTAYQRNDVLYNDNKEYSDFTANEIHSFISDNYNISKEAKDNIMCGVSLGAHEAFYMANNYPQVFGGAICQSFGMSCDTIMKYLNENNKSIFKLYVEAGTIDDLMEETKEIEKLLEDNKYEFKSSYFIGNHSDIYWKNTIEKILMYFLAD